MAPHVKDDDENVNRLLPLVDVFIGVKNAGSPELCLPNTLCFLLESLDSRFKLVLSLGTVVCRF